MFVSAKVFQFFFFFYRFRSFKTSTLPPGTPRNVLFSITTLFCFVALLKWVVDSNRVNLVRQSHCSQWRVKAISAAWAHQNTHRDWTRGAARARVRSPDGDPRYGGGKMSGPFSRVSIMGIYPLLAY